MGFWMLVSAFGIGMIACRVAWQSLRVVEVLRDWNESLQHEMAAPGTG